MTALQAYATNSVPGSAAANR